MTKIFYCLAHMKPRVEWRLVKFLLLSVLCLWLIVPGGVSAQVPVEPVVEPPVEVVDIPDANLRAAIADALRKAPGDTITRADMETLGELRAVGRDIADLRGIEFAINLTVLNFFGNTLSDISPLSSLTNLIYLNLEANNISDISAVAGLTNLKGLALWRNTISDISAVANLTNLTELYLGVNTITDISAVAGLTNLTRLWLGGNTITDISALAGLTNLSAMQLSNNTLSDISPLAGLINLTRLELADNTISDIVPLINLTNLTELHLNHNTLSDIWPLAGLTNLTELHLWHNTISDISAVAGLTNLTYLGLWNNTISDISAVAGLTNLTYLGLGGNTISDISAVVNLTNLTHLHIPGNNISDIDTLERLMAQGTVVYFSGNPAFETPGPKIEDGWVWLILPAINVFSGSDAARSGRDFLSEASGGAVTEIAVAVNGAQAGTQVGDSVWTAGRLDATDPNNLNTIVAAAGLTDIRYPVAYGVVSIQSEALQQTRLYIGGGPLKVYLNGTVVYRDTHVRGFRREGLYETAVPVILTPGENLLFVAAYRDRPWTNNWGAFLGFQDGTVYTVGTPGPDPLDVNGNGQVNVLDLVLVAAAYGARGTGIPADVNADGVVNIQDLIAVAAGIDASGAALPQAVKDALATVAADVEDIEATAEAPTGVGRHQHALSLRLTYENVATALADAKHLATSDAHLRKFVPLLEELLHVLAEMRAIPETTALLPNYPNPFNPETWMPYHLSKDTEVTLTIHDVRGVLVRALRLGHQPAGVYVSRGRAAYWDGRNNAGEKVASGLYFYTLTAGDFNATRKLLVAK